MISRNTFEIDYQRLAAEKNDSVEIPTISRSLGLFLRLREVCWVKLVELFNSSFLCLLLMPMPAQKDLLVHYYMIVRQQDQGIYSI